MVALVLARRHNETSALRRIRLGPFEVRLHRRASSPGHALFITLHHYPALHYEAHLAQGLHLLRGVAGHGY
jgi:hypothetical protein